MRAVGVSAMTGLLGRVVCAEANGRPARARCGWGECFSPDGPYGPLVSSTGRLGTAELLRHRVRHFTQGLALGSRDWVEHVFESHRGNFGGKRKTGARRLREAESALFALRDLKDGG